MIIREHKIKLSKKDAQKMRSKYINSIEKIAVKKYKEKVRKECGCKNFRCILIMTIILLLIIIIKVNIV